MKYTMQLANNHYIIYNGTVDTLNNGQLMVDGELYNSEHQKLTAGQIQVNPIHIVCSYKNQ